MHPFSRRRSSRQSASIKPKIFVVGQRIRIVRSPASYSYNGRGGRITAISGETISVLIDEHPTDSHCTTFYPEELELEEDV
jgi:hypothetical protein